MNYYTTYINLSSYIDLLLIINIIFNWYTKLVLFIISSSSLCCHCGETIIVIVIIIFRYSLCYFSVIIPHIPYFSFLIVPTMSYSSSWINFYMSISIIFSIFGLLHEILYDLLSLFFL